MRKFGKQFWAMACTMALACSMLVVMPVSATHLHKITDDYTECSAVIPVSEGVTCQTINGVLYIKGTGAIPDYTNDTLYQRPWDNHLFQAVNIDDTITYIGAKAFKNFKKLRFINCSVKTYLAGSDVFENIYEQPTVRLSGTEESVEMLGGKVPYTSLGTWATMAFSHANNILYITDDGATKNFMKQKTDPYLTFVFSSDNPAATWKEYVDDEKAEDERKDWYDKHSHERGERPASNLYELVESANEKNPDFVSPMKFAPGYEKSGHAVTANRYPMSKGYLDLMAWILTNTHAAYNYGVSYNCSVAAGDKLDDVYDTPQQYVLKIPEALRAPGREFKAIVVKNGQPTVCDDVDMDDSTITFTTTNGCFQLSIIYK